MPHKYTLKKRNFNIRAPLSMGRAPLSLLGVCTPVQGKKTSFWPWRCEFLARPSLLQLTDHLMTPTSQKLLQDFACTWQSYVPDHIVLKIEIENIYINIPESNMLMLSLDRRNSHSSLCTEQNWQMFPSEAYNPPEHMWIRTMGCSTWTLIQIEVNSYFNSPQMRFYSCSRWHATFMQ